MQCMEICVNVCGFVGFAEWDNRFDIIFFINVQCKKVLNLKQKKHILKYGLKQWYPPDI